MFLKIINWLVMESQTSQVDLNTRPTIIKNQKPNLILTT